MEKARWLLLVASEPQPQASVISESPVAKATAQEKSGNHFGSIQLNEPFDQQLESDGQQASLSFMSFRGQQASLAPTATLIRKASESSDLYVRR